MDNPLPAREQIINNLITKSNIKSAVFDSVLEVFNQLKELLGEISNDFNDVLDEKQEKEGTTLSKRVKLNYRDRGKFEAELRFADDVLIFSMHQDVFQFDRNHAIWDNPYTKEAPFNSYCGIINVYNFLYDSIKYDRDDDLGYLIARIFVNKDKAFFVEGKRQPRRRTRDFGKVTLDRKELTDFVESAMLYSMSFDLLVPPFDVMKVSSVEQINEKIDNARMKTGKRLGFEYKSDDVLNSDIEKYSSDDKHK
ncbi:MAG: hypothetical protein LKM37_05700 [Bacteroidales bacterium]|jgi:hypothetical protein|nr:hypothetical protein [Bacteroidales bacterium]MCI1734000.1 hypothetical protein [Bacteroidales bacterium]